MLKFNMNKLPSCFLTETDILHNFENAARTMVCSIFVCDSSFLTTFLALPQPAILILLLFFFCLSDLDDVFLLYNLNSMGTYR